MNREKIMIKLVLLPWIGFFISLSSSALAEKADRFKPVNLESNRMTVDDINKVSVFEGNVVLTQGTLTIRADKLIVRQDKEGFQSGTALGKPASFRQKREGVNEYVEGYAERIEYDAKLDRVDLYIQARLKRDNDEVNGEHITYDGRSQFYTVSGDKAFVRGRETKGRVRATIIPKKKGAEIPAETIGGKPIFSEFYSGFN